MSEQDEGFFSDLGDMWDAGTSAAEHLGGAAVDFGAGVIDSGQAGEQQVETGWDYLTGDNEGAEEHANAFDENVDEASQNFGEAYDQIF
jgi:hypothetical protein